MNDNLISQKQKQKENENEKNIIITIYNCL